MTALDWVRNKAKFSSTDTFEYDGKTWRVTYTVFKGTVPARMIYELRRQYAEVLNVTDVVLETLRLNGEYRSDFGKVEFLRADYECVSA